MSNVGGLQRINNLYRQIEKEFKLFEKFTLGEQLEEDEYELLLLIAIGFYNEYLLDRSKISYFELCYFIMLQYAITSGNETPLYELSFALGFYPICNKLRQRVSNEAIRYYNLQIDNHYFKKGKYYETLQQKKARKELLNSDTGEWFYLAPTSYGKSEVIFEHIYSKIERNQHFAIIVPLKSLLSEVTENVKIQFPNIRVITHDETFRYDSSKGKIIFVLTQERAINILRESDSFSFDVLYIDEAHHLFENDARSLKLSRVIRINKYRNFKSKVFYFSPIVGVGENLRIRGFSDSFGGFKIDLDMKYKKYFLVERDGKEYLYNRLFDRIYETGNQSSCFQKYIFDSSNYKNFIYAYKPRDIQNISRDLYNYFNDNNIGKITEKDFVSEIEVIKKEIATHLHKYFYGIDYLDYGIIYLHGKLNDTIKEYLEYKFKTMSCMKYLVANNVLLEGVNMPLNKMYVMSTYKLKKENMLNLFGRVNRLNIIFGEKKLELQKLRPEIVFLESKYQIEYHSMLNKMRLLKNSVFSDVVKNVNMESDELHNQEDAEIEDVLLDNDFAESEYYDEIVFNVLHEHNCNEEIDIAASVNIVIRNIEVFNNSDDDDIHFIDLLDKIFIQNNQQNFKAKGKELMRLKERKTRNFYKAFNANRTSPLNMRIQMLVDYWDKYYSTRLNDYIYVGRSFGEIIHPDYEKTLGKAFFRYKDMKDDIPKLYNYASIKIQLDDNFFNYKIFKYLEVLRDLNVINTEHYDKIKYGDIEDDVLEIVKLGLPPYVANKLKKDHMLDYIGISESGNLGVEEEFVDIFNEYVLEQSDLYVFMIRKYLIGLE